MGKEIGRGIGKGIGEGRGGSVYPDMQDAEADLMREYPTEDEEIDEDLTQQEQNELIEAIKAGCFNCGKSLKKTLQEQGKGDIVVLCFDPGSINYPHEPDEPAYWYMECQECFKR